MTGVLQEVVRKGRCLCLCYRNMSRSRTPDTMELMSHTMELRSHTMELMSCTMKSMDRRKKPMNHTMEFVFRWKA